MKTITRRYMLAQKTTTGKFIPASINPGAKIQAVEFDLQLFEDVDGNTVEEHMIGSRVVKMDGTTGPNSLWSWSNARSMIETQNWIEVAIPPPPPAVAPLRLAAEFDVPDMPEAGSW